eukprot:jgi/Mesvir1/16318/Mv26165-RA.1
MDASDIPPQLCWCNKCKAHKPVALFTSVKDGNTHTKRCDPCRARERVWAQKHRREQAERLRQLTTSSRVGANTWRLPNSCVSCPPLLDSTPVHVFRRAPCHTREAVAVGPYDRLACPSSPPPSVDSPKWVSFSSFANSPGGASEIQCVVDRRCDRDDGGASCAGTGYPAPCRVARRWRTVRCRRRPCSRSWTKTRSWISTLPTRRSRVSCGRPTPPRRLSRRPPVRWMRPSRVLLTWARFGPSVRRTGKSMGAVSLPVSWTGLRRRRLA